jgi:hypothetical protein
MATMNRGYVCLWRKIQDSPVFQNEGLLKVFIWCLIRANHQEVWVKVRTGRGFTEVKLQAGDFIFGRHSAAKELKMPAGTVWKRMLKLEKLEILNIEKDTHFSIVTIINWPIYQEGYKKEDIEKDRQGTGKEHRQELKELKNKKTTDEISEEISLLTDKLFSSTEGKALLTRTIEAISTTRKTNRVSPSVILQLLQDFQKYTEGQVLAGMRIYLEKGYFQEGKNERYLLGIIDHHKIDIKPTPEPKSTGSPLLDAYNRGKIQTVGVNS